MSNVYCCKCNGLVTIVRPPIPTYVFCDMCSGTAPPIDMHVVGSGSDTTDTLEKQYSQYSQRALSSPMLGQTTQAAVELRRSESADKLIAISRRASQKSLRTSQNSSHNGSPVMVRSPRIMNIRTSTSIASESSHSSDEETKK